MGRRRHRNRVPLPTSRQKCRSSAPTSPGLLVVREERGRGSELDLVIIGGRRAVTVSVHMTAPSSAGSEATTAPRKFATPMAPLLPPPSPLGQNNSNSTSQTPQAPGGYYIDTSAGPRHQPAVAPA